MQVRYQCGIPSKTWKINLLHGGKRHVIVSLKVDAAEEHSGFVGYEEDKNSDGRVVGRVAIVSFSNPMAGSAIAELMEIDE